MRNALALLVAVVLLAGCSGGGGSPAAPTPTGPATTSVAPPPPPAPTSDTLHFMTAPDMVTALPSGSSEVATPAGAGGGGQGGPGGAPSARWRYVLHAGTNVTGGEGHVWINIKETLFPTQVPVAQQQCTWRLTVAVGGGTDPLVACVNEAGGPIQAGVKEIVFALIAQGPISLQSNETITATFERQAFGASTAVSVEVLSGSSEHDSRIILKGLKEPIPKA